jgi:hypothetical protein
MGTHVGRLYFAQIKEPKGDPRLEGFSTGTKDKWQRDVNKLVDELYAYGLELYPSLTMLGMTSEAGDVLGLCAWRPKRLEDEMDADAAASEYPHEPPYIHLIGISEPFQGAKAEASEHTVGYDLLRVALTAMKEQWVLPDAPDASDMPDVWALVDRNNKRSHELFASHGFEVIRKERGDDRRYRPYGLPIF